MNKYNLIEFEGIIKKNVKSNRYRHIISVEYTCGNLSMNYGKEIEALNKDKEEFMQDALTAGLLHDSAKHIPPAELLKQCQKYKLEITKSEEESPYLLHGKLGAYFAEKQFHVLDNDILNAIRYHTTGRPQMSLLEKIVFVADYIEPNRYKQPNLSEVRQLAYENIDQCVYKICEDTLIYLEEHKKSVDDMTIKTRDYYKNIM